MKKPAFLLAAALAPAASLCWANDFPTAARVEFVLECMQEHPGAQFEMLQKCSCTLDRLARRYKYDGFVEAQTMAKAVTIAGERGAALRENEQAQKAARQYRAAVAEAAHGCFLQ
jgi:hypothetical protein